MHSLINRYLTDTELQNAYDRVTLIAQRTNETENEYADRISEAPRDCANLFEDHALVHYYVRGLIETTRDRVIEDLRRLPERTTRFDGSTTVSDGPTQYVSCASRRGCESSVNANETRPRTPTLCVTEPPMRDRNVTHLPGFERMGTLSDFRNEHPDYAYKIATEIESIQFLGTPGTSTATTPTTTNTPAKATSLCVDLKRSPR